MCTEIRIRITEYEGYDAVMVLENDEEKCKYIENIFLDAGFKYDSLCNCDYMIRKKK